MENPLLCVVFTFNYKVKEVKLFYYFMYTALATRSRATQLQQAEPVPPPLSQQPAQTTQAQTQQQIQNGTPITFTFWKNTCLVTYFLVYLWVGFFSWEVKFKFTIYFQLSKQD